MKLYTNVGAKGTGPNGGMNLQVCGRKYARDRTHFKNGDRVHALVTFDGKDGAFAEKNDNI